MSGVKKWVIPLLLLTFSGFAYSEDLKVVNGKLSYPIGKINENGVQAWKALGGGIEHTYHAEFDKSLHVRSGVTGARSTGTVVATVESKVARSTVLKNVLEKAVVGGRAAVSGSNPIGWALLAYTAYEMVSPTLAKEDYRFNKDEGTFGKTLPAGAKPCITASDCSRQAIIDGAAQVYPEGTDLNAACKDFVNSNDVFLHAGIDGVWKTEQFIRDGYCVTSTGPGGGQKFAGYVGVYYDEYFEPITQSEFDRIVGPGADANPTPYVNVTADASGNIPGLSTSDEVKVEPGTVAQTNPYTNPHTGQVEQARWDFSTDPQGKTVVKETTTPRPDLKPDSAEAPKPDAKTDTDAATDTQTDSKTDDKKDDKPQEEQKGLCDLYPGILACEKMGTVEEGFFDDIKIPNITNDDTWSPADLLPSTGVCPAPKDLNVMGYNYKISYDPLCVLMENIRFAVLMVFIVMSAFITFGLLRRD